MPLYLQTLVAMCFGVAMGLWFGNQFGWVAEISKLIIQWIKILATPLLFFAILDGILNGQIRGRGVKSMLGICTVNGLCAITIALVLSNVFKAGQYLQLKGNEGLAANQLKKTWDWTEALKTFVPDSLVGPFVSNAVPAIILIAILFGVGGRVIEEQAGPAERAVFDRIRTTIQLFIKILLKLMEWILHLIPLAVFGAVAKVVGEHGLSVLGGLGAYLVICLSGMALQILFVYQSWVRAAGIRLRDFWRAAREPALYSFGVNSSLATLPVTLKALDRLKIAPAAARLSACVGTNLNNDGILLYEVVAAFFIAQAHGIEIDLFHQVLLAVICVMATIGVAGIPEAGIISLFLVLSTAGLPAESLPLLLTVDWVVARCRSVTNVLADMTVAAGIHHYSRLDEPATSQ